MRLQIMGIIAATLTLGGLRGMASQPAKVLDVWPGTAPGEKGDLAAEENVTKPTDRLVADKPVIRLGNVSRPTIAFFPAPPEKNRGAAVLVCPGGGYHVVTYDLEGTEICEWLNSLGINGVLLKYRVPKRAGLQPYTAALQDVQRAMGLVRAQAATWHINSNRIGVLGFSAGGHLAAALSNNYESRTYPNIDAADGVSCRPDFAVLIYPAYLVKKEHTDQLASELNVTSNTPPTFMAMTEDDRIGIENLFTYGLALRSVKVPFELHVYPTGGHGYGLRPTKDAVTTWPARAGEWLGRLW